MEPHGREGQPCHFFPQKGIERMMNNSRMIRVPSALHERLARLAAEILTAKEQAQGYDDVPLTEQGERGAWVPLHAVIERAINDFEKHRSRSNPKPSQRTR
jgi:hypothetical protein